MRNVGGGLVTWVLLVAGAFSYGALIFAGPLQSFLSQGVHLVDLFVAGQFPIDRLVAFYDFASINQAAADASDGTTIKPVLRMPS